MKFLLLHPTKVASGSCGQAQWVQTQRKHRGPGSCGTAFLAGETSPFGSSHTGHRRSLAQIVQGQSYFRTCALTLQLPGALFPVSPDSWSPLSSEAMPGMRPPWSSPPFAATLPCFIFAAHIIIRSYLLYLLCVYGPSPLARGPCQSCSPRCPGAQDSAWYTVNTCQRWR